MKKMGFYFSSHWSTHTTTVKCPAAWYMDSEWSVLFSWIGMKNEVISWGLLTLIQYAWPCTGWTWPVKLTICLNLMPTRWIMKNVPIFPFIFMSGTDSEQLNLMHFKSHSKNDIIVHCHQLKRNKTLGVLRQKSLPPPPVPHQNDAPSPHQEPATQTKTQQTTTGTIPKRTSYVREDTPTHPTRRTGCQTWKLYHKLLWVSWALRACTLYSMVDGSIKGTLWLVGKKKICS